MAEIKNPFVDVSIPAALVPNIMAAPNKGALLSRADPILNPGVPTGAINNPLIIPANQTGRRADLLWGSSKSGKGIQSWFAAYWMIAKHGKKTAYLTTEPGSMPMAIENAAKAGIVDIFSLVGRKHLLSMLAAIFEGGRWPVQKMDRGFPVPDMYNWLPIDPDEYGLLIVDSMTSLGSLLLRWMTDPSNKVKMPMMLKDDVYNVQDEGEPMNNLAPVDYEATAMTHIGEACKRIEQYVVASSSTKFKKIIWISREQRVAKGEKINFKTGELVTKGEPMYGPDLPGTAATPRVTAWFGNALHTVMVPIEGVKDDRKDAAPQMGLIKDTKTLIPNWEYRLYMRPHPDPITGFMYDAGNRLPPYVNDTEYKTKPYIVCTEQKQGSKFIHTGINTIYDIEEKYGSSMSDDLQNDFADILAKFKKKG